MTTLERTREGWSEIAPGYDEFVTPANMRLGTEALERIGIGRGIRFLDVAAGSGALGIPAARLGAHVVATDRSPAMLERLEARAHAEGLVVQSSLMDACTLEFEDHTFDVSASQHGVHDLPRALSELTRVTKTGGRVAVIAHGQQIETLGFFMGAVCAVIPSVRWIADDPAAPAFNVAERHRLLGALAGAGLREINVETVVQEIRFGSGKQLWDLVANSEPTVSGLAAGLTTEQRALVQEVLDGMLRDRAAGDRSAVLTDRSNIGIGTK